MSDSNTTESKPDVEKKNSALRTTVTILLSLLVWLLIYRTVHLIVYGVSPGTIPKLIYGFEWLVRLLLSRPLTAPTQDGRFLDIVLLVGSFAAAVYVAMKATMTKKTAALLPSGPKTGEPRSVEKPAALQPPAGN